MLRIRVATTADAAVVTVVHGQARTAYYRVAGYEPEISDRFAMWDRYISEGEVQVVCAEHEGRVVGFLATRVTDSDPCLELVALYVLPQQWALGVGSARCNPSSPTSPPRDRTGVANPPVRLPTTPRFRRFPASARG